MKKLLLFATLLGGVFCLRADVIYWMVSNDYAQTADSSSDEVFASLYVKNGDTVINPALATATGAKVADAYNYGDYFTQDLGSYAGSAYSYYVELSNGLKTDPITYNDAVQNGYISVSSSMNPPTSLAGGAFGQSATTGIYNVPEPTSGLLFIVGGMLLGLKRRRQV